MPQTILAQPSRYVPSRCGRLVEVAVDVSRDILSKGDGSSRGSTLYSRVLMKVGLEYDVREWKRRWLREYGAVLSNETGQEFQLGI